MWKKRQEVKSEVVENVLILIDKKDNKETRQLKKYNKETEGGGKVLLSALEDNALGVLGPTRMPYAQTISTVCFVAGLLSDLVGETLSE